MSKASRSGQSKPRQSGVAEAMVGSSRSEEHTSELQSQSNLVCRLLLEKKKISIARGADRRVFCHHLCSTGPREAGRRPRLTWSQNRRSAAGSGFRAILERHTIVNQASRPD